MNIIDLTDSYNEHIIGKEDLAGYERSYPPLFRHYFRYRAKRKNFKRTLTGAEVTRMPNFIRPG
ncbi:MAG: hypothetical protein J7M18_01595 [Candidatus Eremiobacteraeota bacterium]|nr:hypothetical protein [Candidatus Eremiobacteraeota bacterium]